MRYSTSYKVLGITTVIFLPAVKYLGSEEQYAEWEAKSRRGEIIGAYVSTELGGGTTHCAYIMKFLSN